MKPLLPLLLALACLPCLAQQASPPSTTEPRPATPATTGSATTYDVELLIFRLTSSQGSPEDWATAAALAPPVPGSGDDGADTAETAPANGRFIRPLAASEFQMDDLAARLRTSGVYPLVAHVGWIQNASAWGRKTSLSLQQLGVDVPGLTGSARLERGQFLHLGLALNLVVANPPVGLSAPPGTPFTLNDDHRVKPFERNYYDGPAFGVIALVTPASRTAK